MIGAATSTTACIARRTNFDPDFLAAEVLLPAAFTNALAVFLAAFTEYVFLAVFLAATIFFAGFFSFAFLPTVFFAFLAILSFPCYAIEVDSGSFIKL